MAEGGCLEEIMTDIEGLEQRKACRQNGAVPLIFILLPAAGARLVILLCERSRLASWGH